jgi:solute carrier family 12 (potassium/chloride transporters), member 9
MGVIGSAKLLQALARDNLLPGFSIFGQGTASADEPTYAILFTYLVAQLTMLCDINQIASFVTMTYLMTFLVTNLACFLLKISSAPNFRPSFHYFNWWTAFAGTIVSGATMFFVDGLSASGCVAILIFLFLIIHYTTPPKSWGDVSQSLIYHQVRKYLLRLKQEHVKFWRPQILLFINDPRHQYKLIQFCNSLKKGALYILGHVIVAQDFGDALPEARRQQTAWAKYIDFSRVKAFVNIAISPTVEWGARNLVLSAGLGGMRPNIAIVGFFNLEEFRQNQPLIEVPPLQRRSVVSSIDGSVGYAAKSSKKGSKDDKLKGVLPTDTCRTESAASAKSYVTILEDLLLRLQINVAVAKGFQDLELPNEREGDKTKKYIDLWPIQMSAEIITDGDHNANVLTTNFDTYTLILQLGCILSTVPSWKKDYKVRVAVFVEYEADVEEERGRVKTLLDNLRIEAEVLVFWLASGDFKTYEVIVNGADPENYSEGEADIDNVLKNEEWWQEIQKIRGNRGPISASEELATIAGHADGVAWPDPSLSKDMQSSRFAGLRKLLRKPKRRQTMSGLSKLGVSMGMRTHRLLPQLVKEHVSHGSASEESESDSDVFTSDDEESQSEERLSAASENDLDNLELEEDDDVPEIKPNPQKMRRLSLGSSPGNTDSPKKLNPRHIAHHKSSSSTSMPSPSPRNILSLAPDRTIADQPSKTEPRPETSSSLRSQTLQKSHSTPATPPNKPGLSRHSSMPKFTSKPVPKTTVASEDGPGPSIMFSDTPSPPKERHLEIPFSTPQGMDEDADGDRQQESDTDSQRPQIATGFPAQQAIPLSFNDLPCRAQHLILNELIQAHSSDTAVVFTTLPSPIEGTCRSEEESVAYLSDLEVLCQGLPPVLLIHSNSMTVTTNL